MVPLSFHAGTVIDKPPREGAEGGADAWDDVLILHGLCHGFGSASDLTEVSASTIRWVRATVGSNVDLRLSVPDQHGRLRSVTSAGKPLFEGRKRSARRRKVFESMRPSLLELDEPSGMALAMVPLASKGHAVGLLEVAGPASILKRRWHVLDAIASQAAIAISNVNHQETLRQRVNALESASALLRRLLASESVRDAVRSMLNLCHEFVQAPIAAWAAGDDPAALTFVGVRGVGARKGAALRAALPTVPRYDVMEGSDRQETVDRFTDIMDVDDATLIEAHDALLVMANGSATPRGSVSALVAVFGEALDRLRTIAMAQRHSEQLDLGLALTAHEVRTPLLGAKATIEILLKDWDPPASSRDLLSRSHEELSELAVTVDALLRWAVGQEPLRLRPADLVEVVHEAVRACCPNSARDRIRVEAPETLAIQADARQLRSAVANIVNNAVAYSPEDSEVAISVQRRGSMAAIVVRDRGPGVPPGEREAIFDPLVRGSAGSTGRFGRGLGLFIAQRVVEAHGGTVSLDPSSVGAVFRIEVPIAGRG